MLRTQILDFLFQRHPMMREGLAQLIGQETDLMVCGETDDAAQALEQIEKLKPDLALVDITLRSTSGLELIKDLRIRSPALFLVISHCKSDFSVKVTTPPKGTPPDKAVSEKHLCEKCGTKLVTKGDGKAKTEVAEHTCKGCK